MENMKNLNLLVEKYPLTDKGPLKADGTKGHNYTETYQKFFEEMSNEKLNILEIGFGGGDSLKLWAEFFENSQIYCIDNNLSRMDEYGYTPHERITVVYGDQSNSESLKQSCETIGIQKFDIIIDDGSHIADHILTTFNTLFDEYLKPGGLYFVEDYDNSLTFNSDSINFIEYKEELTTIKKIK
jgi:hypothetical protein